MKVKNLWKITWNGYASMNGLDGWFSPVRIWRNNRIKEVTANWWVGPAIVENWQMNAGNKWVWEMNNELMMRLFIGGVDAEGAILGRGWCGGRNLPIPLIPFFPLDTKHGKRNHTSCHFILFHTNMHMRRAQFANSLNTLFPTRHETWQEKSPKLPFYFVSHQHACQFQSTIEFPVGQREEG